MIECEAGLVGSQYNCVTSTDINLNIQSQGRKPTRSEWSGLLLQLVDRTADDAKASLIAAGYMKGAEDRELIILQAWDRACDWYHRPHPFPKITQRQIRYVCLHILFYF
jgi:hypothetical protein